MEQFSDLRSFIQCLEREDELRRVKAEVDWHLELGAITRRCLDVRGPALLFENIKAYPENFRVLGCLLGPTKPVVHGRLSLALGFPKQTSTTRLIEEFAGMIKREPIPPVRVETGPCKENILRGEEVNLLHFPAPLTHNCDGGRYIGSWHIDVTKDPDTGQVNWGMYRHMVHDEKTLGILAEAAHHGGQHLLKYREKGLDMPIAIAIGTDPAYSILAGLRLKHPPGEVELAGGLKGKPVELVKCETVDLEVPASAEIVIEGVIKPGEAKLEGPYGEFTGYNAGGAALRPYIHVTCITHRNDPILTMTNNGKPWDEGGGGVLGTLGGSSLLLNELRDKGFPIKSVYVPPGSMAAIVSAKQPYPGFSHTLASAIWSSAPGVYLPYIVVVGEDVDVTNLEDVFWCLTTRMHPRKGITIEDATPSYSLIPFLTPEERKELCTGSRALFNATFPAEWPREQVPLIIDFEHAWPKDIQEKVLRRWHEYGLE